MRLTGVLEMITVLASHGLVGYQIWTSSWSCDPVIIGFMVFNYVVVNLLHYGLPAEKYGYRHEDSGLWCCLILPVTLLLLKNDNFGLILLLVPVTIFHYVISRDKLFSTVVLIIIMISILTYMFVQLHYLQKYHIEIKWRYLLFYFFLMLKLPDWFKWSFTFGEAGLTSQIYFCLMSYFFIQPRAALESLDTIAGIVLTGMTVMLVLLYQFNGTTWPIVGVLLAVCAAAGFILPSLYFFVGMTDIWPVVSDLLMSHKSLLLLAWWLVCTTLSIFLVCFYGDQSMNFRSDADRQKNVIGQTDQYDKTDNVNSNVKEENISKEIKVASIKKKPGEIKKENKNKSGNAFQNFKLSKNVSHDMNNKSDLQIDKSCGQGKDTESHDQSRRSGKAAMEKDIKVTKQGSTSIENDSCTYNRKHVSTAIRKCFHAAILCVYVPGLLYRPDLLYLASIGAVVLLVMTEAVRVLHIPPFGAILNPYLQVFLDEQDKGDLILTPIYLLIGCSLPLWIANQQSDQACSLVFYSGLISIGVGDSAASIFGKKFGRHRWPGSKKTFEGTAAAVVSQLVAIKALEYWDVPGASVTMVTTLSVIFVSCLEAFTSQIDNLVVPAVACMLFATIDLENR